MKSPRWWNGADAEFDEYTVVLRDFCGGYQDGLSR